MKKLMIILAALVLGAGSLQAWHRDCNSCRTCNRCESCPKKDCCGCGFFGHRHHNHYYEN